MICTSLPGYESVTIVDPPVDLSDPTVLAAAISKTEAVARTLLTSDGKVLDVTASGNLSASLGNVKQSADAYRKVFLSKEFSSSPARLGLLSQHSSKGLAEIRPWEGNRISKLRDAVVLTPNTIPQIEKRAPFKLDPRSRDLIRDRMDIKSLETSTELHMPM